MLSAEMETEMTAAAASPAAPAEPAASGPKETEPAGKPEETVANTPSPPPAPAAPGAPKAEPKAAPKVGNTPRGIVKSRPCTKTGATQYRVRWEGLGRAEDSWVGPEAVPKHMIERYERKMEDKTKKLKLTLMFVTHAKPNCVQFV